MQKVSIVGLGWIGMPLAFQLRSEGYQVVGSKRTEDAVEAARMVGIPTYLLSLTPELECEEEDLQQLLKVDALVITLPASRRVEEGEQYRLSVQMLVNSALAYQVPRILFLSSTSVYGHQRGILTEATPARPVSYAGTILLELEQWLHGLPQVRIDILRLAGLVGPERHPGRFLAGRKQLPGKHEQVNMVHQDDVIGAISRLLSCPADEPGTLFNLCAPEHPHRGRFYIDMSEKAGLQAPEFVEETPPAIPRFIDGSKICRELGFMYRYPNPTSMPFS